MSWTEVEGSLFSDRGWVNEKGIRIVMRLEILTWAPPKEIKNNPKVTKELTWNVTVRIPVEQPQKYPFDTDTIQVKPFNTYKEARAEVEKIKKGIDKITPKGE